MSNDILSDLQSKAQDFRRVAEGLKRQYEIAQDRAERAERIAVDYEMLYAAPLCEGPFELIDDGFGQPSNDAPKSDDLFDVKAIEAMFAVLSEHPDQPMHAKELAEAMQARGWVSESDQPRDTISVALRRRSDDDIARNPGIERIDRAGRATYVWHSEPPEPVLVGLDGNPNDPDLSNPVLAQAATGTGVYARGGSWTDVE